MRGVGRLFGGRTARLAPVRMLAGKACQAGRPAKLAWELAGAVELAVWLAGQAALVGGRMSTRPPPTTTTTDGARTNDL